MFQRTYELSPSGGRLELLIREPNVHDRHPAACTFQIIADGELWKEFTAYGVDKLQSLQLALVAADANLASYSRNTSQQILWDGQNDWDLAPKCTDCGAPRDDLSR
jgi:hypothetical protein